MHLKKQNGLLNERQSNKWSTISISPGTVFMSLLSSTIKKEFPHAIISCDKTLGEGEQKIINELKKQKENKEKENKDVNTFRANEVDNEVVIIYSPDADMIVLSSLLFNKDDKNNKQIIIMRPGDENNEMYVFLSIPKCLEYFEMEFPSVYRTLESRIRLLDYFFMLSLCGNDFVTGSLVLKIKDHSIELLIDLYNDLVYSNPDYHIINPETLDIDFDAFFQLIRSISLIEQDKLMKWQKFKDYIRKRDPRPDNSKENLFQRFQHSYYFSQDHPQFHKYIKEFGPSVINYYDPEWHKQYNKYYGLENTTDVCLEYIKSIVFCWHYYTHNKVDDWQFYYKYRNSPTFADLINWYDTTDIIDIEFEHREPLSPFEQLLVIIPRQFIYLLPSSLQKVRRTWSNDNNEHFELDVLRGQKYIYSEVRMTEITPDDILKIKQIVNNCLPRLSQNEKLRNVIKN